MSGCSSTAWEAGGQDDALQWVGDELILMKAPAAAAAAAPSTTSSLTTNANSTMADSHDEVIITFSSAAFPSTALLPKLLGLFQNIRLQVIRATLSSSSLDAGHMQMSYYIHARKEKCVLLSEVIAHICSLEEKLQDIQARLIVMPSSSVMHFASNGILLQPPIETAITTRLQQLNVQLMEAPTPTLPTTDAID